MKRYHLPTLALGLWLLTTSSMLFAQGVWDYLAQNAPFACVPLGQINAATHKATMSCLKDRFPVITLTKKQEGAFKAKLEGDPRATVLALMFQYYQINEKMLPQLLEAGALEHLKSNNEKTQLLIRLYRSEVNDQLLTKAFEQLKIDLKESAILYRMIWADYQHPLKRKCLKGRSDLFVKMISHGANPNWTMEESEMGLLHLLVSHASFTDFQKMKALVDAGADVSAKDQSGQTPLDHLILRITENRALIKRLDKAAELNVAWNGMPQWLRAGQYPPNGRKHGSIDDQRHRSAVEYQQLLGAMASLLVAHGGDGSRLSNAGITADAHQKLTINCK
jgi:hypothetical protein